MIIFETKWGRPLRLIVLDRSGKNRRKSNTLTSIRKWHVDPKFMFPISQERCVKTHNLGGYRYMTVLMPRHTGAEQFGWWDLTALLGDIDSDEKVPEVHHQDMANTLDCRLERPPLVAGDGCRRSRPPQE